MATAAHERSQRGASHGITALSCAPHAVLTHLGDKWTILVVLLLAQSPGNRLRFSEIKYGVEGISQRMLTLTLRMLERNGLVLRHYFAEVPPRVEYELSAMGKSMLHPLEIFASWIGEYWPTMEQARKQYDESLDAPSAPRQQR
jgi:DNA-binding HxlR family transcriptional regulator